MNETRREPCEAVVPYLSYGDGEAAIDFLTRAFGFEERMRWPMDDGRIGHAELVLEGGVLMLASAYPELGLVSPLELPAVHGQVKCVVADVDAHHRRAVEAGATVLAEPEDGYGERSYRAVDPEGHRWIFGSPIPTPDEGE